MVDIVRTDDVLGGEPRLAGRRISVLQIAEMVLDGEHAPEYVADQLDISLAAVHTALAYYYEHPEEMAALHERHAELERNLRDAAREPEHVEQ